MKNSEFGKKLRSERERLGYSQLEVANMLHKTQSTYSRIESGVIKPSADHLQEIATRLEAEGFANLPPIQFEEHGDTGVVKIKWRWNKNWLYAILVLLAILLFDYLLSAPDDIARGLADNQAGKPNPEPIKAFIVELALLGGVIYGLYRFIKWFLSKRF